MINLPYNVPLVAPIMPTQSIPVQTSQNNMQPFHQPQTVTQQMQTSPVAFLGNPQDSYKPYYQLHQSDVMFANHQYMPNPPPLRNPYHLIPQAQAIPNPPVAQTQASCGQLPPSIVEQIRSAVSNTAPIFILPGGCHQSAGHQQQQPPPVYPSNQGGVSAPTGPSTGFNYPPSIYCPPSFVPYPIPLPLYEPFAGQTRGKERSQGCGCCHHRHDSSDTRNHLINSFWSPGDSQEHHCTHTMDDTVCSKRNCPASVSLQALASQFLSLPGIVSCAATRLILRKVRGSNITNSTEEIMEKAQKAIGMLGKDQLLAESRIAQQVNALINLHATTNLPASIIPLLMLVQTKVNVLKAQIENLVNRKVMECQGYGFEVETSGPIDPAVLALKSNAELRQLLGALRQKECDESVNVNFAPYHSQRVIAESRLHNVRAKIRQVEVEFDNRRQVTVPGPTLTSQIIRQFSESRCTFGYAPSRLFDPCVVPDSPDPFSPSTRNPRRLYIKPHQPEPPSASGSGKTPTSKDTGTGEGTAQCDTKDQSVGRRCSKDSCICDESSSEDSLDEDKKKLRAMIDRNVRIVGRVTILEPHEEDHSNVEDGKCQAPCEVPGTVEEGGSKEPEEAAGSSKIDEHLKVEESESKLDEGTKVEHAEEQVVPQSPEDSSECKVTEAEGTKEEQSDKEEQTSSDSTVKETKDGAKNLKKKGYANIRVIKAIKKLGKTVGRSDKSNLGDETKPENGNVQIVSMMTNIVYDRSAGDFGRYMTNNCTDKKFSMENPVDEVFRVDDPENAKNAEKISSSKVCSMNEEREHENGVNSCLRDLTERQSTFTESPESHNREVTGDFKHFPPLRRAESKSGLTRISQSDRDRLDSSKIDRDRSTSGHQEASSRVASAIRSMIADRLDYVGSLVDNVPNLRTIISSLYSKRLWRADCAVTSRQGNMEPNKTAISRKDDWILLPTDIDRETETQTRERHVPAGNKLCRVRKIRHTIISNRADKSYVLIGGSTSGQLRELSGIRLIKPSGIRRSFVIRSRLKDQNVKQLHPPPVVSLRRFKTDKMSASPKSKGSDRRLEPSEKFCSLSDKKGDNTDRKVPSPAENYAANYNRISDDRSELITNVYDYSAEQEQLGVQSNGHHEFISIWQ
ncbi:uncharacterized protein LOC143360847 [Halictus rubicundus]|uniref:uncharacterized protein LOC143360847 n=1 Tax=Halictus rubicundus TaxID=77578 RepID=UPI004035E8BD